MKCLLSLMTAALLAIAPSVFAEDGTQSEFRCGTQLVETGTPKVDVLAWCGEPSDKEGSQWIYMRSSEEPDITVHFEEDDTVNRITAMDLD